MQLFLCPVSVYLQIAAFYNTLDALILGMLFILALQRLISEENLSLAETGNRWKVVLPQRSGKKHREDSGKLTVREF